MKSLVPLRRINVANAGLLFIKGSRLMKYFFDTEFIEYPCTIDLISIGIISEDWREYYAINEECDVSKASPWVKENVLAYLDSDRGPDKGLAGGFSEKRKTKQQIRDDILSFTKGDNYPEFWAYYGDYDWVVFCWLFGTMDELPDRYPMFCRDIRQLMEFKGSKVPKQTDGVHNALLDARWNKMAYETLMIE